MSRAGSGVKRVVPGPPTTEVCSSTMYTLSGAGERPSYDPGEGVGLSGLVAFGAAGSGGSYTFSPPTTSQVPRPRDATDSRGMAKTTQRTETIRRTPPLAEDSDSRGVRNSRQPGTHCPMLLMAPHSVTSYGEQRVSTPRVTRYSWPCVRSPASEVMKPPNLDETMLRLAATAHLGRYSGVSWTHSESDLQARHTTRTRRRCGTTVHCISRPHQPVIATAHECVAVILARLL